MNLPEKFVTRMKDMLGDEYEEFEKSYDNERTYSFRINPLKYNKHFWELNEITLPFELKQIPWASEGFFTDRNSMPGKHPLHEAGAYYIQEPSAMSVVSLLEPEPGDIVCDLCAAPGGKSTQIAGRLEGRGLLVSNEIFNARAKILSQNIERLGVANAVVCNESPDRMAEHFSDFFNKIVVDAPCSGEGMFRKDETAIQEWSPENVEECAKRQQMILECADKMLKKDGVMVYSTCTFAPYENEDMLISFLRSHPEYEVQSWKNYRMSEGSSGLESGREEFVADSLKPLSDKEKEAVAGALRLWPHKIDGEGHFVVRLHKKKTAEESDSLQKEKAAEKKNNKKQKKGKSSDTGLTKTEKQEIQRFIDDILCENPGGFNGEIFSGLKSGNCEKLVYFGDELYLLPEYIDSVSGIKVLRAGLHVATRKKNRFEPAHAFAKALSDDNARQHIECDFEMAQRYIHGETINCSASFKGWTLVCYEGCSLGWAKAAGGVLKNHYPKGLRR